MQDSSAGSPFSIRSHDLVGLQSEFQFDVKTLSFFLAFEMHSTTIQKHLSILFLFLVALSFGILEANAQEVRPELSYSSDVRPILSNHCFQCHGPDEDTRQAGLRLDIAEGADLKAIIQRINSDDPDEIMPPPSANKVLDSKQIEILQRWIDQGANYEQHWSFVAPKKATVPTDQSPVDYFIRKRLQENKMALSAIADPSTRLRRVYLDLIGIPPTLEQADAFLADPSQVAYEKVVDELLASERYGERWARRWLDLARYSDTNGFEKDKDRSIWPYRDWVIRAINKDMPFDQFSIEQLAGDMLANATVDQKIATGFHRNTMLNEEGGIDPLEDRFLAMVDRVATTGTTWLGLTTGCAQCHTHKFDPITHRDYFGMMAYLNNTDQPDLFLVDEASEKKRAKNLERSRKMLAEIEKHWPAAPPNQTEDKEATETKNEKSPAPYTGPTLEEAFETWISKQRKNAAEWQTITPREMESDKPYLTQEANGVIFAAGDSTKHDTYTLRFNGLPDRFTSIRLEALPDERLPGFGPGMTYYEGRKGDFYLAEFKVNLSNQTNSQVEITSASETFAKSDSVSARRAIDDDFETGWSISGQEGFRHVAVFNLAKPIESNTEFTVTMELGRYFASSLGKFRLSVADANNPLDASLLMSSDMKALHSDAPYENEALRESFLLQAPQLTKQADEVRKLVGSQPAPMTLVMAERPIEHSRTTLIRNRGEFTQPKDEATPQIPDAIWGDTDSPQPTNRLEFAQWLVSRQNPLTARVVANRQWAAFFGTGIVSTLDDFGMQGEPPTHPQLLDFLAVELMDSGWSTKKLHRLIVTSQTYQQSSKVEETADAQFLYQRFPRTRLEGELIRDSMLFAAGKLNLKMYGSPIRPPQPAGAAANYKKSNWKASKGDERFRRSVYIYQRRTAPFEMLSTFDATSGESCVARRDVSNTPLQALTLMNDPMFIEISEAFGKRVSELDGDVEAKIATGFRWLLTRSPSPEESKLLTEFYEQHKSWPAFARALLSLDESITKN